MFWNNHDSVESDEATYGLIGDRRLDRSALDRAELARARGALAYLKARIGNDGMRELLAKDLAETARRTEEWAVRSDGYKSANLKLVVPGPDAASFHRFFMTMMAEDRQLELRAAHPDHFMNRPLGPRAEVIENVGQDDLPWLIHLEFTEDESVFPTTWDPAFPERLGAIIYNQNKVRIGSAMHELRDLSAGTEISLTISLVDAAPDALLDGHLHHFAVEFRNWTQLARQRSVSAR